jgi:hypothetical protein
MPVEPLEALPQEQSNNTIVVQPSTIITLTSIETTQANETESQFFTEPAASPFVKAGISIQKLAAIVSTVSGCCLWWLLLLFFIICRRKKQVKEKEEKKEDKKEEQTEKADVSPGIIQELSKI